ncbi:unnamed protein product [Chrysodeixis includens]|uniref:Uncharacterized protein n=1 Tax=Chrysodeixis includens TaxID=689277 RepID=A0A9P0BJZ4_CHRIL|nr:unnamed protein product [Chrysodeixis includens]
MSQPRRIQQWSDTSLDANIPSLPGSPRELVRRLSIHSITSAEETRTKYKRAIEFLHSDNELLIAAEVGDETAVRELIQKGCAIDYKDHLGRTALHFAVCSGNNLVVMMLLKAGINPNIKDNVGMTPLSLCLMRRPSLRTARLLFQHGALLLSRMIPMDTGLFLQFVMMCKPTKEDKRILRLLVEKGALVDDPEAPGQRQALHFAAMSNNCDLIAILMELGADLYALNHRNETPKQVAAIFKCRDAFALLEALENNTESRVSETAENESETESENLT